MQIDSPNESPEPTAAAFSVLVVRGGFAAPGLRRRPVSGGCGSALRSLFKNY
jgi:hypothetical protein